MYPADAEASNRRALARRVRRSQIARVLHTAPPPYALRVPELRFPSLAALAGRAPLGGQREVALACFVVARLAADAAGEDPLPAPSRAARAAGARMWLASLALPPGCRSPFGRAIEASAGENRAALATALVRMVDTAGKYLDPPSVAELDRLAKTVAS